MRTIRNELPVLVLGHPPVLLIPLRVHAAAMGPVYFAFSTQHDLLGRDEHPNPKPMPSAQVTARPTNDRTVGFRNGLRYRLERGN